MLFYVLGPVSNSLHFSYVPRNVYLIFVLILLEAFVLSLSVQWKNVATIKRKITDSALKVNWK